MNIIVAALTYYCSITFIDLVKKCLFSKSLGLIVESKRIKITSI